jgi:hypothetical protein
MKLKMSFIRAPGHAYHGSIKSRRLLQLHATRGGATSACAAPTAEDGRHVRPFHLPS